MSVRHESAAEQAGFTLVPNHVLYDTGLSLGARLLYGVLKSYAWQGPDAWPGQERLSKQLGVSARTVRDYLNELIEHDLVAKTQRGLGQTNVYTILTLDRKDDSTPDRKPASALDRKLTSEEVDEVKEEEQDLAADKPPRARNVVWDALEEVTGYSPATTGEASDFGKTAAEIKRAIPADASYEDVLTAMEARKVAFHRKYEGAVFTHRVLRNKWGELGEEAKHGRFVGGFDSGRPPELPEGETF